MIKAYQQFEFSGKKTIEKAVVEPPFRVAASFANEACFYYIIKGCNRAITPTGTYFGEPEEGLVLRCGNYINEFLAGQDVDYCEAIAIHLSPDILSAVYDREFPSFLTRAEQTRPVTSFKVAPSELLRNYIEGLQFYFDNPELVSEELLRLKLKELILLLFKTDNADTIRSLITGLFTPAEIDFKTVIETNLFNNLTLEELALLTNLSLSSFKREFAKHYDLSPAKYIKKRKLAKAAQLLRGTELRVADVAYDCGFTDVAHFSKAFQRAYGAPPSNWRRA